MTDGFLVDSLFPKSVGHDDFFHRRKNHILDSVVLQLFVQDLLTTCAINDNLSHISLTQESNHPLIPITNRLTIDCLDKETSILGSCSNTQCHVRSILAILDTNRQLARQFWYVIHLELIPLRFRNSRFLVVSWPKSQTLDIMVQLILTKLSFNFTLI